MRPFDECPPSNHVLIMNIIIWNSRGSLKPNFQNYVRELAQDHDLAIMVIRKLRLEESVQKRLRINCRLIWQYILIPLAIPGDYGCYGIQTERTSSCWQKQSKKYTSLLRYVPLISLSSFLLCMQVLGRKRGLFSGTIFQIWSSFRLWLGLL